MQTDVVLTVAEGKRLIGKGIAADEVVQRALTAGTVAVTTGTTNGYVIEELSGEEFAKYHYVTGNTMPSTYSGEKPDYTMQDYVARENERVDMSAVDAVSKMSAGDVFLKGVNAINYEKGQAGVLIGHPEGGTVGKTLGRIISQQIQLIHPVGLEKSVPIDLNCAASHLADPDVKAPSLWVVPGRIFTEVEALKTLADVSAVPIGAGGICGAEGAVRLLLKGERKALEKAHHIIEEVQGEPEFEGSDG